MTRRLLFMAALVLSLALTGCGDLRPARTGPPVVVASFYPLQFVGARVSGAAVTSLTRPGVEPHDLELRPRDVATAHDADVLVYLRGFQPAVDDVADRLGTRAVDVSPAASLDVASEEDAGSRDPHFWLDPTRLADVADSVARRLGQIAPADAGAFARSAAALRHDLLDLDGELRAGLESCRSRSLVTGHEAFGYLARRYGLQQLGVTGLDPEAEPDAADLAAVAEFVRREKVLTVYTETLASPDVARALAAETGVRTAVLDPVESRPDAGDYLTALRADLVTLRQGQGCS